MTTDNTDELRDIELEIVMTRACNNLAKGTFADLDNKLVNWPLLFTEVRKFIIQDREKAYLKGRTDEAKTCEKAQRHDVEKAVLEVQIEFLKEALALWRKNERKHHSWLLAWFEDNNRKLSELQAKVEGK
jgi:hypothetical protein